MNAFRDEVAVVTGGGSGIGRAIAFGLAQRGMTVCLVGRRAHLLESVAETIRAMGRVVRIYPTDITSDEPVQSLCARVKQELRGVDVLVHSAGSFFMGELSTSPLGDFDAQYHANVRAPLFLTQALLPLIRVRRGQIVFINSSLGLNTRAYVGQYSATQHALKAVADTLRQEVNAEGIRVLSIYPGRTATARQAAIFEAEGRAYRPELLLQPEDIASIVINALELSHTAEVTDIKIRPLIKSD